MKKSKAYSLWNIKKNESNKKIIMVEKNENKGKAIYSFWNLNKNKSNRKIKHSAKNEKKAKAVALGISRKMKVTKKLNLLEKLKRKQRIYSLFYIKINESNKK